MTPEFRARLTETANALGVSPVDLATVISYETGGTFDPAQPGPRTKWGQHKGLIQFGEPQAQQYGVDWSRPLESQLGKDGAVVRYLTDRGFQRGGSLLDMYSTINAGAPGLYDRSDAAAGGMPGTVRDKVETQFAPHRERAMAMLAAGGETMTDASNDPMREAARAELARRNGGQATGGTSQASPEDAMREAARAELKRREQEGMTHRSSGSAGRALSPAEKAAQARDVAVYRERPIASGAAYALSGVPFVGEGIDELAGALGGENARGAMQAGMRGFAAENPTLAPILRGGTGLATGLGIGAAAAPAIASATPAGLGLQTAAGIVGGGALGALEGGLSGYLSGEGEARTPAAVQGARTGALVGAPLGALAPLASAGMGNAARYVRSRPDASLARSVGGSPPSAELVGRMLVNDDPAAIQRALDEAGPAGMMADAGPATSGLLDAAIQSAGPAGQIARRAIDQRAAEAGQEITSALDQFLGKPRGIKAAARDISGRTAAIRKQAYDNAYASPIDYASPQGRAIEDVLGRIPPRQAVAAIQDANEEMISLGERNMRIMAQIGEDGRVVFQEMPNVRQLDALKQALDKAGSETDIFGRATKEAIRPQRLARELRKALGEAVPAYNRAVQLGGQKIAEDKALDTGRRILQDGFSREDVADALENAPPELVRQAKIGLRRQVEEVMANVKRSIGDPNMDAREGIAAMKALSSRATREKLEIVLGKTEAEALTNRIDRASRGFELRANIANNTKTAVRQDFQRVIDEITAPGMVDELLSASPVQATRKLVQSMTNMTPEARQQVREKIAGEIATILTGPRGQDAKDAAVRLIQSLERVPATEELARRIGRAAGVTVGVGGYQAGSQMLQPQTPR